MNTFSLLIDKPEVAALLLEMTSKTAVAGPNAANLAYLHTQALQAVAALGPPPPRGKEHG
jgi:hypothetical protein